MNIPGLGFAQPNETLPPAAESAEPSNTTNPSTSEQTGATQPPTPTNEPTVATAVDSSDKPKETDVTMEEPQPSDKPQPAEDVAKPTADEGSMEVEKGDTTTQAVPTTATVDESKPSDATQQAGEAARQPADHDSMVVENQGEATQHNAPPAPAGSTSKDAPSDATPSNADAMKVDEAPNGASITDELEAALGGLAPAEPPAQAPAPAPQTNGNEQPDEHPEWEMDSSPYASSSSVSSDTTSSADSDDAAFNALNLHEAARMLMDAEGGSDDEGGPSQAVRAQVRSKNEMPEEVLPKPEVTITEAMKIVELGVIQHIVEATIVVKAVTPGEYQVIDTGSVLCTGSRTVVGALADVLGKVQEPLYTVRFGSAGEIKELGLEVGTQIYYSAEHANYVFTSALKNIKGSDASNLHDEEIREDEAEFSDDEKEAEYKRALKQKRRERNAERGGRGGGNRGPHPLRSEVGAALDYDDEDGPYKPLARPPGFGSGGFGEAAEEPVPGHRGRGRGGPRGRGPRGRGRGRGGREGYSAPQGQYPQYAQQQYPPQQDQPQLPSQQFQPPQQGFNFGAPALNQMFGQQPQAQAQPGAQPAWGQMPFAAAPSPPAWAGQQQQPAAQGAGGLLTPQVLEVLRQYQAAQQGQPGQGWGGQGSQGDYGR